MIKASTTPHRRLLVLSSAFLITTNYTSKAFVTNGYNALFARKHHSSSGLLNRSNDQNTMSSISNVLALKTKASNDDEELCGGGGLNYKKYEMVEIPDRMVNLTLYIGNIGEFTTDEEFVEFFKFHYGGLGPPCAIARRVDCSSLGYGFVSFSTEEQAEEAIAKFNGVELNGNVLKVERMRSSEYERAKVPETLVSYILGEAKTVFSKKNNDMTMRRISRDDVERLSRGQPAKKKGYGSRGVPHRLNENERKSFERAARYGFVTLDGTGYRRGRKGSPLANIHRQWCDARAKPQIVLCKATGGRMLDNLIIDLSTLRLGAGQDQLSSDALLKWNTEILIAAERNGLELRTDYEEDNTATIDNNFDDSGFEDSVAVITEFQYDVSDNEWATEPIWRLPAVSLGVFEGERSKAKAMARDLSKLWDVPEEIDATSTTKKGGNGGGGAKNRRNAGAKGGGRTKMKGISELRKKSNNNRSKKEVLDEYRFLS